jgi:hypothetical protein
MSFRPPGPKPGAYTNSATPAQWFEDSDDGYGARMADEEQRERESRESDVTKFEELTEQQAEEQKEAAQRIAEPLEPQDE